MPTDTSRLPQPRMLPQSVRRLTIAFFSLLATLFVVLVVFFWVSRYGTNHQMIPTAHDGVLDLRGIDLSKRPIKLDGEWAYYGRTFITPQAIDATPHPKEIVSIPKSRVPPKADTGLNAGQPARFATLHLHVLLDPQPKPLAIRLDYIHSAFALWANGKIVAQSGQPATRAEDEVAKQQIQIVVLPDIAGTLDLVVHTSEFHQPGSSFRTMYLGEAEMVWKWQNNRWIAIYLVSGALLLMAVYHIVLFLLRRDNRPALYFGLYALAWMVTMLAIETDWAIRLFFPDIPADLLFVVYRVSMPVSFALSYHFMRSFYPEDFSLWFQRIFWAASVLVVLFALFAPVDTFLAQLRWYYPLNIVRMVLSVWGLSKASWRHRDGARIILFGYITFILLGMNDMLSDMGVIDTPFVMHFGAFLFMVSQSLALASRFSRLFDSVQQLSEAVVEKNHQLETEVSERIQAQQDIVAVSETERARISHELHDGLCQYLTGARLLCSSMGRRWPVDTPQAEELARLSAILDTSVNHAYDLSHGLWPVEADDPDLRKTLQALVDKLQKKTATPITLGFAGPCAECRCANTSHIHSIAREAITNAIKHAKANRIEVMLDCRDKPKTVLSVTDDGVGWTPQKRSTNWGGMGLRIMAYRSRMVGGDFRLDPGQEKGCRIISTIPCVDPDELGDEQPTSEDKAPALSV